MNVLFINTTDTRGGAAKVAYSLKKELEKRGHQSPMLVGRKYSRDENVSVLNDMLSFSGKVRRKLAYWLANDIDVFSSDHILKTKQFKEADIVHCHNLHSNYFNLGTLKKISAQKPIVWTFHDLWPITAHCAHSFHGKVKNGFFQCPSMEIYPPIAWHNEKYLENRKRGIYEKSQFHIVTVSHWLEQKVKQTLLGNKPVQTIYNGVDTSIFKPHSKDESRKILNLPLNKKIILSVIKRGQSNPWKGADYVAEIIELFKNRNDILFICLGGDLNDRNEKIINISYTKDQIELAKYYSAADILLYPSIADTFGLVAAEAQACGLPVAAFETGGVPEIVEHKKTGYIAEYKDIDNLIKGVEYLLNLSLEETEKMRNSSINKTKTSFTLDLMTDGYLQLYEKILRL